MELSMKLHSKGKQTFSWIYYVIQKALRNKKCYFLLFSYINGVIATLRQTDNLDKRIFRRLP